MVEHEVVAGAEYLRQILIGHGVDRNAERMHAALGERDRLTPGRKSTVREHNTSFTAFNYDYRVVVLSDCVASMYGEDLHALGLQNVARCLGWVITNEQFFEKVRGGGTAAGH